MDLFDLVLWRRLSKFLHQLVNYVKEIITKFNLNLIFGIFVGIQTIF